MSTAAPAAVAPKSRGKLILLIVAIVLLVSGAVGAGVYFFTASHSGPKPVKVPPPVFFPLEAFTVNLAPDQEGNQRYARVGLTLKLASEEQQKKVTDYLPEVRSRILLLLSSKRPDELGTVEGKRKLVAEIRAAVQKPFVKGVDSAEVNDVLLTDFVIQ